MANEGVPASQPGSESTVPNPQQTPASTGAPAAQTPAATTGAPPAADNGWVKEKAGLLADLKKEREARQRHEQAVATHQAELAMERKRVQALSGVTPTDPQQQEVEAIRARFKELFPHLADLTEDDVKALRASKEAVGSVQSMQERYWADHTKKMLTAVESKVAEAVGGELTARQRKNLHAAFSLEAETDENFLKRFEAGDSGLAEEFAKSWTADWFEPARRQQERQITENTRRVPFGKDRSLPGEGGKKVDVNDNKAVEDILVAGFKSRGGRFDR